MARTEERRNDQQRQRRPEKATAPPNAKPRGRGARQGDPEADSIMPGREFGAGQETVTSPHVPSDRGRT